MEATTLTLHVPPAWWMTENSNRREHWSKKKEKVKNLRALALSEAMRAGLVYGRDSVHITAHLTYPDRRARDTHNAMPVLKACIDGLVDYGLIPDDNDRHLIGPDLRAGGVTPGVYTIRFEIVDHTEGMVA